MPTFFRFVNLTRFRLDDPSTPGPDTPDRPDDKPRGEHVWDVIRTLVALDGQPEKLRSEAGRLFDRYADGLREHDEPLGKLVRWARSKPGASLGDLRAAVKTHVGDGEAFFEKGEDDVDRALAAYAAAARLRPAARKEARAALTRRLRGAGLVRLALSNEPDGRIGPVALAASAPPPPPRRLAALLLGGPPPDAGPDRGDQKEPADKTEAAPPLAALRAARDAVRRAARAARPPEPVGDDAKPQKPSDGRLDAASLGDAAREVIRRVGGDPAGRASDVLRRLDDAAREAGRAATAGRRGRQVVPYAGGLVRRAAPAAPSGSGVALAQSVAAVPSSVGTARVLGVGELMLVRESLLRYEPAEIAHVENVMASEVRGRTHTARTETTTTASTSTYDVEAATHEMATAARFELEAAASKTSTRSTSFGLGTSVSGGVGPVNVAVEASFDTSSSTTTAESSATTFAQEVTERATTEIRNEVRTATSTEVRVITKEVNEHRFDNVDGDHVTGVYRWLNKVVEAQVFRYGQRMMLEFVVPEPAAYLLAALGGAPTAADALEEPPPFETDAGRPLEPTDVDEYTYLGLAAVWGAEGIAPPPPEFVSLAVTLSFDPANQVYSEQGGSGITRGWSNKEATVAVPEGYRAHEFRITSTFGSHATASEGSDGIEKVRVGIANDYRVIENDGGRSNPIWGRVEGPLDPNTDGTGAVGEIPIVATANQRRGLALAIEIVCERTGPGLDAWRLATYRQLRAAYDAAYAAYKADLEMATFGGPPVGLNPGTLRDVEAREVKRACLELLTGQAFDRFGALVPSGPDALPVIDPAEAEAEGEYLQFFEDAFEWPLQSYVLYPYAWAGRDRHVEILARTSTDPVHEAFLQAGAARVTVPVRLGYEAAVARYLADGVLWNGFGPPTPDEMEDGEVPYLPIFELLAERLGRPGDEEPVGEPWEVTVPTPLVYLQPSPELNPA